MVELVVLLGERARIELAHRNVGFGDHAAEVERLDDRFPFRIGEAADKFRRTYDGAVSFALR